MAPTLDTAYSEMECLRSLVHLTAEEAEAQRMQVMS